MSKVYVFFAEGFEEIEALTVVDMLRRVNVETVMVSIGADKVVKGAHNIPVVTDGVFTEFSYEDGTMAVLPGGMPGTVNLEKTPALMEQVKAFANAGKYVAAICAAPSVLGHLGILAGKTACCYPGFEEELTDAKVTFNSCEVDGNVITARGMGCAIDFSVEIINTLLDGVKGAEIASKIVYKKIF
jgi:4-methyl-5(b-hydroxyethyl)-thiazole monophosphate biosynthesis